MSVYKACDIRGEVGQLSRDLYTWYGNQLGGRLDAGARFVIGGDVRLTTPDFLAGLSEGLTVAGMQVENLGIVPTPLVYFAKRHGQAAGCAIVTASHSPPETNGLKWMLGNRPPTTAEVKSLEPVQPYRHLLGRQSTGQVTAVDLWSPYRQWLKAAWWGPDPLVVAVDPGNGCWSGHARECLEAVLPQARLLLINDRPDGRFPDRDPDSAKPAHLAALSQLVVGEQADIGIAFDGDGDRVAFVDNYGQPLTAEEATFVLLDSFGDELQDQTFVYDLKFSDRIAEAATELGAKPRAQRSGHAFIRDMMLATDARFGAEISGHFFDRDLAGGDDGMYTACRLLRYLAQSGQTLAELRSACPPIYMTPDLRVAVSDPAATLALSKSVFRHLPQDYLDGVRIDFEAGWVLLRQSVTEAKLTLRFEGHSPAGLETVMQTVLNTIPELAGALIAAESPGSLPDSIPDLEAP